MNSFLRKIGLRTNVIAYPKIQSKYAALMSLIVIIQGVGIMVVQNFERQKLIQEFGLSLQPNSLFSIQVAIIVVASIFSFLAMLGILHRFLGPIPPIIKYFESIKNGNKNAQLVARQEDGLTPLIEYLKSVEIQVKDKNS